MMRIIRAAEIGMCFGVRDALEATRAVTDPTQVTIHGELVHNPTVIRQLDDAGFRQSPEDDRDAIPETPLVLITAHGISNAERSRLRAAGRQLLDTTCPLVRRVHEAALQLQAEGRHVLLIGKPGHVEVRGIVEDLHSCDVVSRAEDVRTYPHDRLGIVCQTTMPTDIVGDVCDAVWCRNPDADIRFIDTVCQPTKLRQQAMRDLLTRVDMVVVVGGRNSNNTRRLVQLCDDHGVPAWHIEQADELQPEWFRHDTVVGLTAGTSTLDSTIDDVEAALRRIAASLTDQEAH